MRAARANEVSWAKRYWYRIAVGFRILAPNRPRGGLRVLAKRDGMGSNVGGGDPAATPAAPAADGRTSRQQDAAAEALTEMFANIKFELCLDQRLAEAAALRSAKERKES